MRTNGITVLIVLACAALAPPAFSQQRANRRPTLDRVDVTRWTLAFGRLDNVRPVGINTPENPNGAPVVGVTPSQAWGTGLPAGTISSNPGFSILDWIAAQPNPLAITLDQNPVDGRADDQDPWNDLIIAGSRIPSGMTLVVAEGASDPDGDPTAPRWQMLVPRYGGGNYYATVNIPAAGIVRGQELYTQQQLDAYQANSVIYEAPDSAFVIVDNQLDGGTKALSAKVVDAPRAGGSPQQSELKSRLVGFADPLQVEIVEQGVTKLPNGDRRVRLIGQLDNGFEAIGETFFRWAIEIDKATFVEIPASNVLVFDLYKPPPPGQQPPAATPAPPANQWIPRIPYEGGLISITLVAASHAPGVSALTSAPPFVKPVGSLGNSVGLDSFIATGNTLSDTETIQVNMDSDEDDDNSAVTHSICILLDASGSMRDDGKMDKAKASATRVLQKLGPQTEVALIVYYDCGSIVVEAEFTTDKEKVLAILPRVSPSGGTPLAAGTSFAKDYMRRNASGTTLDLIILTDGQETCQGDPIEAARN